MTHPAIRYVITTHRKYLSVALPRLLLSLTDVAGIARKDLLVVCGGSDHEREAVEDGVEYSYVQHNSFDHTGLIDIVDKCRDSEFWFALHDTCEAGPGFRSLAARFDPRDEHVASNRVGWHNTGLFSRQFLLREADYIQSLRNCGKARAYYTERVYPRLGRSSWYGSGEIRFLGFDDVYGTGVTRARLYYPSLDLYKYQANWRALEAVAVLAP